MNDERPESASQSLRPGSLWFVIKAIEIRLRFIVILIAIALVIGYWDSIKNHWDKQTRPVVSDLEYYCPMHPQVVRPTLEPNGDIPSCPICGMKLSKRLHGESAALPAGVLSRVELSPYRVSLAGAQTTPADFRPLALESRAVGYVTVDERRLSRLVVRVSGYVEKLYVNESFTTVREGDKLADIYSPELYAAAQELMIARSRRDEGLVELAREKLRLLGVAPPEIQAIEQSGKASSRLTLRAPHGGHIFDKRIVEGDSVSAGQTLFEVADLSTVWIESEVYAKDAILLQHVQEADATIEAFPGETFHGRLRLIHPHVENVTRTTRVRLEIENSNDRLTPGMFATVTLRSPVMQLEPYATLLREQSDPTLTADERIAQQSICPVQGTRLGSMGKPLLAQYQGHDVYLCCRACLEAFNADPQRFVTRLQRVNEAGVLSIPETAVIDTGTRQVVYVERSANQFEGVAVELGPLAEGYYPVISGVLAGDRVVSAGAFLIDAETRLNPALAASYFGASGSAAANSNRSATPDANDEHH